MRPGDWRRGWREWPRPGHDPVYVRVVAGQIIEAVLIERYTRPARTVEWRARGAVKSAGNAGAK